MPDIRASKSLVPNMQGAANMLLYSLYSTLFSSAKSFGTKFREFSVPRNSRNSVGTNYLISLFRRPRNYFLSQIPNPIHTESDIDNFWFILGRLYPYPFFSASHIFTLLPDYFFIITSLYQFTSHRHPAPPPPIH